MCTTPVCTFSRFRRRIFVPTGACRPVHRAVLHVRSAGSAPMVSRMQYDYVQNDETTSAGHSTYNGLTASLTKKYGHGLQFQANYTWSKAHRQRQRLQFAKHAVPSRPVEPGPRAFGLQHQEQLCRQCRLHQPHAPHAVTASCATCIRTFVVAPIVQVRDGVPVHTSLPGYRRIPWATVLPRRRLRLSNPEIPRTSTEARPFHEGRNLGIGPELLDVRPARLARLSSLKKRFSGLAPRF